MARARLRPVTVKHNFTYVDEIQQHTQHDPCLTDRSSLPLLEKSRSQRFFGPTLLLPPNDCAPTSQPPRPCNSSPFLSTSSTYSLWIWTTSLPFLSTFAYLSCPPNRMPAHVPIVKKRTKVFKRHQSDRYHGVKEAWRKPKGASSIINKPRVAPDRWLGYRRWRSE